MRHYDNGIKPIRQNQVPEGAKRADEDKKQFPWIPDGAVLADSFEYPDED